MVQLIERDQILFTKGGIGLNDFDNDEDLMSKESIDKKTSGTNGTTH